MEQVAKYQFEDQSMGEEIANSISHGVGVLFALAATSILIVVAALEGSAIKIVGVSVFGATMILLYTASTLYHGIQNPTVKRVFHVFDHSAIFTLIAGTYTPVTLCAIQGEWGWTLFGVVWGFAVLGVVATAVFFEKARYFNLVLYIAMGWLIVITGPKMFAALSTGALFWLLLGGVFYTGGVYFYRKKNLHFHHMIWHLFVLLGSTCHFFLMLYI